MPHHTADYWVRYLELAPLPDGGYYRETYRSTQRVSLDNDPTGYGPRPASTAILYLLTTEAFQAFHQLAFDEIWHYYAGTPCQLHLLHPSTGRYESVLLGNNPEAYQRFQVMLPAGTWFAAEVAEGGDYTLVGCTVAPGFTWADYKLASADALALEFPSHSRLIERFARRHT